MIYGVHSIFPPPDVSGHHGEDPISQKKMDQGNGTWSMTKEILGWLVDGANFTIQLTLDKFKKVWEDCKTGKKGLQNQILRSQKNPRTGWKVAACILWNTRGKGLFSPIHRALNNPVKPICITAALRSALQDWQTLVQHLGKHPTPIKLLVTEYPNFLQYIDAIKLGSVGVITPGLEAIQYWLWQYEWPLDIQRELVSANNKGGRLTINDLEVAA